MNKDKFLITIATTLTVVGLLIMTLWAIGKAIGWIHSPDWVEMMPMFGAVATLTGISISIGKTLQKLDRVIADVKRATDKTDNLTSRVITIETKLEYLE